MNGSEFRVRRATLEDINSLLLLWRSMRFDTDALAKRITEFQVVEDPSGAVAGAIGLQLIERQGRIHSEAFTDFALADSLRQLLWERIQRLAANQGLLRLWTREDAPFWKTCELILADAESLQKLPTPWRQETGQWLTLKLKDDLEEVMRVDKEFALFMHTQKERSKRALARTKVLKYLATLFAFAVLVFAIGAALYLVRRHAQMAFPSR
jgi:hypothetical protein